MILLVLVPDQKEPSPASFTELQISGDPVKTYLILDWVESTDLEMFSTQAPV